MTLLNASVLSAACSLLVPIFIHLHRKRKAKVVEWPAMQFLTQTLARRHRGLALENLLLLFVRCLVILLFVLAMAQPLLPSGDSPVQLVASLVLITGGLIGLSVAAIRSLTFRTRFAGIAAAVMLLTGAVATLKTDPEDFSSPTENCDLVIVLDETSSMLMEEQQDEAQLQSRFADAVDEAVLMVDRLSGSSTVGIVRCGPVVETIQGSPLRDLLAARRLLTEIKPTGGGASTGEAIDQAIALANKGPNSRKQVVLFTDDQLSTWESFEESAQLHSPNGRVKLRGTHNEDRVHLAVHLANLPAPMVNVSVVSTRIKSPVLAVGQPLLIEANVRNHGDASVASADLQLSIDGRPVAVETVDVLPPATTTTLRFRYTFELAGEHVVTARTPFADAMMDDNRYDSVVSVVQFVSVLLVNGNEFAGPGDQSATFLQLSLDPISRTAVGQKDTVGSRPIRVESVNVSELDGKKSLSDYDVIVLSEVPQLPHEIAPQLSRYVYDGGSLWVIPDQQANTTFYNDWKIEDSETYLLPAMLLDYQQTGVLDADDNAARMGIDFQAIASGFVSDLIKTGENDLAEVVVSGYRKVTLRDSAVTGMKLTSGDPLFVEHTIGRGRVLLQTVALGRQESNLPQRVCFPVLMHLWSYYLADCQRDDSNFEPAPEISVPVFFDDLADTKIDSLLLTTPSGEERTVNVVQHSQNHLAQVSPAGRPGIYTLSRKNEPGVPQSFTVARDGRESDLAVISKEKLDALQSAHDIQWFANAEQLRIAGVAELAAQDLSPHLLLVVLCLIAAESLLAAWIRRRRMVTTSPPQPARAQQMRPTVRSNLTATASVSESNAKTLVAVHARGAE